MSLDGKVAIISGAGPNIGRQIATTLAENGARVVCLDVRSDAAQATAEALTTKGFESLAVQADITVPDDVARAVDQVVEKFGAVDILVNNAAITHRAGLLEADVDSWRKVVDVILTGTFLSTQRAAQQMIAQGTGGAIVNIASTSGHRGKAGAIAYQTAKAGILNFTRGAAMELAPYGIRVNSVTPTQTGTPVGGGVARSDDTTPGSIPRGRWGRPTDQAQAVLFLVSDSADFIVGVDLPVDGGNLAQRDNG